MKLWQTLRQLFEKFGRRECRVVLDTNILISATINPHGAPARIIAAAFKGKVTLVVSDKSLSEYLEVIRRPHIIKKYHAISESIREVLFFLRHDSIRVLVPYQ